MRESRMLKHCEQFTAASCLLPLASAARAAEER